MDHCSSTVLGATTAENTRQRGQRRSKQPGQPLPVHNINEASNMVNGGWYHRYHKPDHRQTTSVNHAITTVTVSTASQMVGQRVSHVSSHLDPRVSPCAHGHLYRAADLALYNEASTSKSKPSTISSGKLKRAARSNHHNSMLIIIYFNYIMPVQEFKLTKSFKCMKCSLQKVKYERLVGWNHNSVLFPMCRDP
ncbi:hypothetical protein Tco_0706727 [Tanacetum coccineum]|uniref:Uncharacterized protein n=1 Tax=Tanacetum coccineum TaxID=301880 RepID=A0ABQ4Y8A2_9ASTR